MLHVCVYERTTSSSGGGDGVVLFSVLCVCVLNYNQGFNRCREMFRERGQKMRQIVQ